MSGASHPQPGNPAVRHDEGNSAGRAPVYDQRRARARLALLEQEVTLAETLRDLQEAAARPAPPPGIPDPWEPSRATAERAAAKARHWISELARVVGDPESVADEHRRLPRDRRDRFLSEFAAKVNAEASSLTGKLPALNASLKTTRGRQERAAIREELGQATARLAYLQALPPFTASDMCSECPSPMAWHATGVTFCLDSGAILSEPCRSWPVWNAKIAAGLARFAEMMAQQQKTQPAVPPSQLLAVIAAGSPLEDVIAQLTHVRAEHPGARVQRGKKDSWEIWSARAGKTATEDQARPGI